MFYAYFFPFIYRSSWRLMMPTYMITRCILSRMVISFLIVVYPIVKFFGGTTSRRCLYGRISIPEKCQNITTNKVKLYFRHVYLLCLFESSDAKRIMWNLQIVYTFHMIITRIKLIFLNRFIQIYKSWVFELIGFLPIFS